jgi:bacterioferritin
MGKKQSIIQSLNGLLAYELAAMDQYFIHSEMYADWGYTKLAARIAHEQDDEKLHAKTLIARILLLGGTPDMVTRDGLAIGTDVVAMLTADLAVEKAVAKALKQAIALCEKEQDFVTRDLLMPLLTDTECDHAFWLSQQLTLIETLGLPLYLQSQL